MMSLKTSANYGALSTCTSKTSCRHQSLHERAAHEDVGIKNELWAHGSVAGESSAAQTSSMGWPGSQTAARPSAFRDRNGAQAVCPLMFDQAISESKNLEVVQIQKV